MDSVTNALIISSAISWPGSIKGSVSKAMSLIELIIFLYFNGQ